ncbi:unnamed protein product [Schistosoma curassoni]|uniref:Uncharacterized protein n=1 Tax=Schistosoma curassoni TaxID=6186 RepID=A0A183JP39_9TREM|nr:unnamed protein product [Schistosoma curassoni]
MREPTYLNAALNAFGYGCKPDWKHFCVSPSARRLAHARQSMKVKQIEGDSCNTTLSNNNTEYDEISNNKKMDYDDHENENKITNEKCTDSKLKQTIEYSCDVSKCERKLLTVLIYFCIIYLNHPIDVYV